MQRSLHTFVPVSGDAEGIRRAFADDPESWLPDADPAGSNQWTTTVHAGQFSRTVTAEVGPPHEDDQTQWRALSWEPSSGDGHDRLERFLPSLVGELGLNVAGENTTLIVDARYEPPGGAAGAALDTVALHQVARRTLERFLLDIADRLKDEAEAGDGA